ncbi:Tenacilysin precursor [Tenacibaculum maritimum]|nr:Tenacilysin precursor [Tenacibaculum maritimum]CAA0201151.1 Tenacilysin precursor [Tenacibaculum maritimum]
MFTIYGYFRGNFYNMKSKLLQVASCLLLMACSSNSKEEIFEGSKLNDYVEKLPSVEQIAPFEERKVSNDTNRGRFRNDDFDLEEYEVAVGFDEQFLFSANDEIFYPGSLVVASSVIEGEYVPITVPRAPLKISTSLVGDKTSITVDSPKLSSTRDAISSLLSDRNFEAPPASLRYTTDEVFSKNHLKVAIGASYEGTSTSVSGSAEFNYDKETTKMIVKVIQKYYTIDSDIPSNPSDFFVEEFNFKSKLGDRKPLYVSSVTYGRVFLMSIESTMNKIDLEAALQGSFLKGKITAKAEFEFSKIAKTSTIKATILGGNSDLAGAEIGDLSAVKDFISKGASYSKENPGIPIAYRLRELGTNEVFKNVIYSKYTKRIKKDAALTKRISFDLNFNWGGVKSTSGADIDPYYIYIKRTNRKTRAVSENRVPGFGVYYWTKTRLEGVGKDDVVYIIYRDSDGNDNHAFKLPETAGLIRRGLNNATSKDLFPYDSNPYITSELYHKTSVLKVGIESHRIF